MSYAAYLSEKFGIREDRILHRQPGFFKGVSDGMKGAADWLASQGIKVGRASKGSGTSSGQRSSQSSGQRSSRSSGGFSTDMMANSDTRTRGAQAALDHFRIGKGKKAPDKYAFNDPHKGLSQEDGAFFNITGKFKKDGKDVTGVKRQVFPKEYKDNPKFKGGRFAGDKDVDGNELKAGDQYVAEALDVIIEAINQGHTDNDALELAKQYLCEEYGFGPWSARRVLNEVLSEQEEE